MKYAALCEVYHELESTSKRLRKTHIISQLLKKTHTDELPVIILFLQGKLFPAWDETKTGFSERYAIKAINIATGLDLKAIEREFNKTGDLGLVAEEFTKKKKQVSLMSRDLTTKKVYDNLTKLAKMEGGGSVDHKVKLVAELLTSAKPLEARYIIRAVLEQMRVGVGSGSLRDAIVWSEFKFDKKYDDKDDKFKLTDEERKDYNEHVTIVQEAYDKTADFAKVMEIIRGKGINAVKKVSITLGKPLKVMLYPKAQNMEDAFKIAGSPAALEFKYDGFRCISGFTPIYIKDKGLISVRDVKIGDFVLTHKGRFKKILAINKRKIDKGERVYKLQSYLGNPIKITEKHTVLVERNSKIQWIPVEKIDRKRDNLVFPIPKIKTPQAINNKLKLSNSSGYSKQIKVDLDFYRFLGYWLGDGFTNDYHNTERVGLIFNAKTGVKLKNKYKKIIENKFQIKNISENIHNGAVYLYWRDKPIRIWLSQNFRREWKGKYIPEWLFSITKMQFNAFLEGWVDADGHKDKLGRIGITTKERDVAMNAQILGLIYNKIIAIKKLRINSKTYYKLIITKSKRYAKIHKNKVIVKILKHNLIKDRDPRLKVYNLQVQDDESYCSTMMSLHNCQIHVKGNNITIFTRRLENVTKQFPDVIKFVKQHVKANDIILDSEAVGYDEKTGKYVAFQSISQRIRRKYDIELMAKDFPVELNVFDVLYYNGESTIDKPFEERRKIIEKVIQNPKPKQIVIAEQLVTDDVEKANKFYQKSLAAGNEGVMVKALDKPYKPGSRVGYGVKVKPVMETLDLVIVGAQWGEGKRAKWLTSFTLACRDHGEFLTIGKVGTGFKELEGEGVSFSEMTKMLKPLVKKAKGKNVDVDPSIVIEVAFEEIQKSPTYGSGYALRFPRLVRLRDDRAPDECSSLTEVERMYEGQRGRG